MPSSPAMWANSNCAAGGDGGILEPQHLGLGIVAHLPSHPVDGTEVTPVVVGDLSAGNPQLILRPHC